MIAARMSEPGALDDGALLEACRRGDRASLERLLAPEVPRLARLVRRLTGAGPHVDDVVQDALAGAVVSLPGFRGEAPIGAWLRQIAVRSAYRFLRSSSSQRHVDLDPELACERATPDQEVESRRALAATYRHLARLTPKKRVAFVLHVFEGLTVAEVAATTGASQLATKARIHIARKELMARARRDPELSHRTGDDR
jgi:RNA polymerase sigma-70 factor (ECF subfamily)